VRAEVTFVDQLLDSVAAVADAALPVFGHAQAAGGLELGRSHPLVAKQDALPALP